MGSQTDACSMDAEFVRLWISLNSNIQPHAMGLPNHKIVVGYPDDSNPDRKKVCFIYDNETGQRVAIDFIGSLARRGYAIYVSPADVTKSWVQNVRQILEDTYFWIQVLYLLYEQMK